MTEISEQKNEGLFGLDMTLGEVIGTHPQAAEVLAAFSLGGCAHCAMRSMETLGQACASYGIDGEKLIEALENLPKKDA